MILYHIASFSIGVLLDLIIGDPYWLPHPIRLIGRLIGRLDKALMDKVMESGKRDDKAERKKGILCVLIVLLLTLLTTGSLLVLSYMIAPILGILVEAVLTFYCLAAKSLKTESMKVYKAIDNIDIEAARYAVSMIVGRDTNVLDDKGIIRAAVETVAENTSDGVIAPMLYLLIGGPVLGMIYKAVNTMDSMIAYHNDRYENFGSCAAKLDDIVNFIPSRLSAALLILASYICKEFNGANALKIFKRDRFNHKSPNSAQTESACAGALCVQLAGDAYYFGKLLKKPFIGDAIRDIENEDIKRVNKLMYLAMFFMALIGEGLMVIALFLIK